MTIRPTKEIKTAAKQALSNNWLSAVCVTIIVLVISYASQLINALVGFIVNFIASISTFIGLGSFGSFFVTDFFDIVTKPYVFNEAFSGLGISTAIALGLIATTTSVLMFLFTLFVSANFSVGTAKYYLNLVCSDNAKISDIFFSFKNCPLKCTWASLLVNIKIFLWGLLGFVPFCIVLACLGHFDLSMYPAYVEAILWFCLIELFGIMFVLVFYATYRYSLVYFVLAQNPTLTVRETVKVAVQTIKGYKMRRFILDLSFIGWYLLCSLALILTFGIGGIIGTLFLTPYVCACRAVQFCDITGIPTVRHDFVKVPYQVYQENPNDISYNSDSSHADNENNE